MSFCCIKSVGVGYIPYIAEASHVQPSEIRPQTTSVAVTPCFTPTYKLQEHRRLTVPGTSLCCSTLECSDAPPCLLSLGNLLRFS